MYLLKINGVMQQEERETYYDILLLLELMKKELEDSLKRSSDEETIVSIVNREGSEDIPIEEHILRKTYIKTMYWSKTDKTPKPPKNSVFEVHPQHFVDTGYLFKVKEFLEMSSLYLNNVVLYSAETRNKYCPLGAITTENRVNLLSANHFLVQGFAGLEDSLKSIWVFRENQLNTVLTLIKKLIVKLENNRPLFDELLNSSSEHSNHSSFSEVFKRKVLESRKDVVIKFGFENLTNRFVAGSFFGRKGNPRQLNPDSIQTVYDIHFEEFDRNGFLFNGAHVFSIEEESFIKELRNYTGVEGMFEVKTFYIPSSFFTNEESYKVFLKEINNILLGYLKGLLILFQKDLEILQNGFSYSYLDQNFID